jgi:hypothetical protein
VGVVIASLLVGACGGTAEPLGPTATVPQATTTTNAYAVPAVIDEVYVNRVLAGLDQVVGDVARLVVSSKTIPPEAIDRLRAIYVEGDVLQLRVSLLQRDFNENFASYAPNPGNPISTVTDLLSVSEHCVFASIERDYSQVAASQANEATRQWIAIERADRPPSFNPTGWVLTYDGFAPDGKEPRDPCSD